MGATGRSGSAKGEGQNLTRQVDEQGKSAGSGQSYAQVLIDRSIPDIDQAFTYAIPPNLADRITVGSRVLVPFGPQKMVGDVVAFTDQAPPAKLKAIISCPALLAE